MSAGQEIRVVLQHREPHLQVGFAPRKPRCEPKEKPTICVFSEWVEDRETEIQSGGRSDHSLCRLPLEAPNPRALTQPGSGTDEKSTDMSFKLVDKIKKSNLPGPLKKVLEAYVSFGNSDGTSIRPTADKVADRAGCGQRIRGLASRPLPDVQPLRDNVAKLRKEVENLKRVTTEEQARLADQRRHQAELREEDEQLRALAGLALKHLGDHCPVCAQTYDRDTTRKRLENLSRSGAGHAPSVSPSDRLNELLSALTTKEKEVTAAELALRTAEQSLNGQQIAEQSLTKRLAELGIRADDNREAAIDRAVVEAQTFTKRSIELQQIGESLALRLAQSSAMATIDELRREANTLRHDIAVREKNVTARTRTGDLAQSVIEALREAASAVVEERLREINPLLQNIWARIDPHPAFRLVSFFSQVFRGKGQLSTIVSDPIEDKKCEVPAAVLSSSQVNALAVSVFLALNIGIPKPPLPVAILDDPLQSLDDINLLGLVDLFRRTKDRRQFLVSTHDAHFGGLLSRKLRPADQSGRTVVIELDTWSRVGPAVVIRDVNCDPVPLRLVS